MEGPGWFQADGFELRRDRALVREALGPLALGQLGTDARVSHRIQPKLRLEDRPPADLAPPVAALYQFERRVEGRRAMEGTAHLFDATRQVIVQNAEKEVVLV